MKTILMVSPKGFAPSRFYRGEGVFEQLRRLDPDIQIIYPRSQEFWQDLIKADIVFFMKIYSNQDLSIVEQAFSMGKKVWYDMDDDLFNVPPENPAFKVYSQKAVQMNIGMVLANADVVTVSTQELGRQVAKIRKDKKTVVVPNAIDDYSIRDYDIWASDITPPVISWRGGGTHIMDLLDFTREFWDFMDKMPPVTAPNGIVQENWMLHFLGFDPFWLEKGFSWDVRDARGRFRSTDYIFEYFEFMGFFRNEVRPWAHIVPLRDNPFNRSKSNISALEAIYTGAIPIVPDWEEWKLPGVLAYDNPRELSRLMVQATKLTPDHRKDMWRRNVEWVKENAYLSKVNLKRLEIIKELL